MAGRKVLRLKSIPSVEAGGRGKAVSGDRLLFTILDSATYAIMLPHKHAKSTYVNAEFTRITGYTRADVAGGRTWFRQICTNRKGRHEVMKRWKGSLFSGSAKGFPLTIVCKDGERKVVEFRPGQLEDGRSVMIVSDTAGVSRSEAPVPDRLLGIEFLPDATFAIDREKRVIAWNGAIEEMTGVSREEIMGKGGQAYARAFYHDPHPMLVDLVELPEAEIEARYDFIERRGRTLCAEAYVPGVFGGRGAHLWATACPLLDNDGEQIGSIESLREITEQKETEGRLRQTNKNLMLWVNELEKRNRESTLLNEMGEFLQTCVNKEEAYEVISRYVQQLFPGDGGALYILSDSKHLLEAVAVWGTSHSSRLFAPDACWSLRRGRVHEAGEGLTELSCSHVTSKVSSTRYACIPLIAQGEALGMLYLQRDSRVGVCGQDENSAQARRRVAVNVAEHGALALANLRLRETLRHQAIRDPLTGLYNRRYMEESLERELSRAVRRNATLGVVMLDLDHFKRFNDTFGHAAGDTLLRELGTLLNKSSRGEDLACRYGGEEFTLIFVEAHLEDVVRRANQLREEVKHLEVRHHDQPLGAVTVSMGVSVFPSHGTKTDELLLAADAALYRAKAEGRDRVVVA